MHTSEVEATVTQPGLHHWPDAPDGRGYLRHPHRHLFVVTACVRVSHEDRDVEYHDLQDLLRHVLEVESDPWPGDAHLYDFGPASCETIAALTVHHLTLAGLTPLWVRVSEDGENASTYRPGDQP